NVIGRNTQGVRIMNVDEGDSLIAVVRVPAEEVSEEEEISGVETQAEAESTAVAASDQTATDTAEAASTETADGQDVEPEAGNDTADNNDTQE
ncbi:DNA gyrase subunit A, partial [bacterium]|nr:DNA gyrase subunit A [bacterium]